MKPIYFKGSSSYIDAVILVLIVVLVLVFAFTILPLFTVKQNVTSFADELAREMETIGIADTGNGDVANVISELRSATGLNPTITVSPTGKIQLGKPFTVTVSVVHPVFSFGNRDSFPITISSSGVGRGEKYWKN